jgi:hypothetical protein
MPIWNSSELSQLLKDHSEEDGFMDDLDHWTELEAFCGLQADRIKETQKVDPPTITQHEPVFIHDEW